MGGRVIFKPGVFDLGFKERVGFPFFPVLNFGLSVGFSPEGGRVNPPADGFATMGLGEGGALGISSRVGGVGASGSSFSCGSSEIGAGGGRFGEGGVISNGAGGGREGSSLPNDGNGGVTSSTEFSASSSSESKGAGVNLGRGGSRSTLSPVSSDSSERGAGAISDGAGGGREGSSSPNEGRGGEISSSVFFDISLSASKGGGVKLGSGGRISASLSSVSWGSSTGRGGAISKGAGGGSEGSSLPNEGKEGMDSSSFDI